MKTLGLVLALTFALLLCTGCGNAQQQSAYDHAVKLEQQMTAETAPAIIAEYQKAIRLQPDSKLAKKAQARIDAIAAAEKAAELHKNVFHETGID